MTRISCSPEEVAAWQHLQDLSEPESVPEEIQDVGGFEFFVVPRGALPRYSFGGFTEYDTDEKGEPTAFVTMLVSPEVPVHVRGFLVAHLLKHKLPEDVYDPHMCVNHDRWLQHEISEREPSLLLPFFDEAKKMYEFGLMHKPRPRTTLEQVELTRYERALRNSKTRGGLVMVAAETQLQLADQGIEMPDGELALVGENSQDGRRWFIKLGVERGRKGHTCKNCSHHISRGSERITTVIETLPAANKYTHHHYHPGCFTYIELARFNSLEQVPAEEVPLH